MGKSGNGFPAGLREFQTCIIDDARGKTPADDRAHCMRRFADRTIAFLQQRAKDRPFYAYLAPPVPHDPRAAEEQFAKLYRPADIVLSKAFLPLHPFDNGEMTVRDEQLAPWPRTEEDTRKQLADYYACVTGIDFHVGRIFEELKNSGQFANTIVIFTGDNGLSLGEHGLFGKQNLHEFGGMHVPLVIAGPGIPKGKSEALVYLMDLFPTFCDWAGATPPQGIDGKSLLPVIQGKQRKLREVLYTGYRNCMRAVRDDRWKLIRYPLIDKTQLFDLAADPLELNDLAAQPEQAARVAAMLALLQKEMRGFDDPHPLRVDKPLPAAWQPPAAGAPKANKTPKPAGARRKNKANTRP
jgi:arylsulfatase A-like enzyme